MDLATDNQASDGLFFRRYLQRIREESWKFAGFLHIFMEAFS